MAERRVEVVEAMPQEVCKTCWRLFQGKTVGITQISLPDTAGLHVMLVLKPEQPVLRLTGHCYRQAF